MIIEGFLAVLTPFTLLLMVAGVAIGIVFGSMPGLSTTMAVALFLPLTYSMKDTDAMALLMALYIGAISGGLVSAILLKIPGTPSSVATCWDGSPMAQRGEAVKALGAGVFFSFLGTIVSIACLIFLAPTLARFAMNFGFHEYFAIAIFSLSMVATMGSGNMKKGIFSALIGFMFATVGIAPIDAAKRFTFGSKVLLGGFNILPVLIGLFAVSEILILATTSRREKEGVILKVSTKGVKGFGFSVREFLEQKVNLIRSCLIGVAIGILPGIGGGTSNILAYTVAKNQSKHPERFGTGILDGVVASETANNASVGGAMIPLLALGIPGDTVTAILLGAFTMHGLTPGPLLFKNSGLLVYAIFASMILCSVIMLVLEFYGLRFFVQMLRIPKHILMPLVFVLCALGAFGISSRVFDVFAMILFGVLGLLFKTFDIPTAPFILGFILGPMAETNLRRGLMAGQGWIGFFQRPIAVIFFAITALSLFMGVRSNKKKRAAAKAAAAPAGESE